jgi:predicted Zn-dependent peptidase
MRGTYRKDVLPNGVRVVTESTPHIASTSLGFWVGVGSSVEPPDLAGVSHFIEHILFKGTRTRSAFDIANALESVGGTVDAFAGKESTAFVARCLPEHVGRAVDVISDMLTRPAIRRRDIEMEKRVILEEIRNFEDTPDDVAHELLATAVWNSDPLGKSVLGTPATVCKLARERVVPFFKSFYVAPNVVVAASGKVDHDRLVRSVRRMLKLDGARPPEKVHAFKSKMARVHNETRKVSQAYICLGTLGPRYDNERRHAHMLLSMIVGGGMTSRLFQRVRDEQALAYTVYSSCEFYRNAGIFYAFLAVDPRKARRALGSVMKELKRLRSKGLERGELPSVKQQLRCGLLLGMESSSARMNRLARQEIYAGTYHGIEHSLRQIDRVTEDHIMDEARRLFDPSTFSLVTVGPSSTDFPKKADLGG